jgi:hypothetical protein
VQCLQEPRPRVLPEQINPADVAAQRVQRLVPRYLGQLPDRGAGLRCAGQEPAAKTVAAEDGRIEPDHGGVFLHDDRGAAGREGGLVLAAPPVPGGSQKV